MPLEVSESLQYPRKHPVPEVLKNSPVNGSIQKTTFPVSKSTEPILLPLWNLNMILLRTLEPYHQQYFKQTLLCSSPLLSWMGNNSFSVEGTLHSLRQATQFLSFNKIRRSTQCRNIEIRINWHLLRIYYAAVPQAQIATCITSLILHNLYSSPSAGKKTSFSKWK